MPAGRSWGRTYWLPNFRVSCPGREPSPTTSPRRAGSLMHEFEGEARWGREELLAVLVPHFQNGIAVAAVEERGIGEAREDDLRSGGLADPRGTVDYEKLGQSFPPGGSGCKLPKHPKLGQGFSLRGFRSTLRKDASVDLTVQLTGLQCPIDVRYELLRASHDLRQRLECSLGLLLYA